MSDHEHTVRRLIAELRGNGQEDACHRLIEMGARAEPALEEAFRCERDGDLRRVLLRILWQTKSDDLVPILAEGLEDGDPNVWKEALDGLTAVGGPRALDALRAARRRAVAPKAQWIDEAIAQVGERRI
jgi:HEAT repeat protein